MEGFRVKSHEPGREGGAWLSTGRIQKLGGDVAVIPKIDVLAQGDPPGRGWSDIINLAVSTRDGRHLGKVSDLAVESDTWRMTHVALTDDKVIALDPDQTVLGPDVILVQAGAEPETRTRHKPRSGFWSSLFGSSSGQQAVEAFEAGGRAAGEAAEEAGEAARQTVESLRSAMKPEEKGKASASEEDQTGEGVGGREKGLES